MAFKINYLFEGNTKHKPEQNLSGSKKPLSREAFLHNTHEERRKRQEHRRKIQSAEILQSHVRSYLERKRVRNEQRIIFDKADYTEPLPSMLSRFLFFYTPKDDKLRLFLTLCHITKKEEEVVNLVENDTRFSWLMKRFMVVCLKNVQGNEKSDLYLNNLSTFTNNYKILEYLLKNGYYKHLRYHLENSRGKLDKILQLIHKPFRYLTQDDAYCDTVLSEFCSQFLIPVFTSHVKSSLFPYLKRKLKNQKFTLLTEYLNKSFRYGDSDNIFYAVLALEPDEYDPVPATIQVLAKSSKNIHRFNQVYGVIPNESDDEEMEQVSVEQLSLSDFINILNNPEKVKRMVNFLSDCVHTKDVLIHFIQFCNNLLLSCKDPVRKYLLLYKLGLSGEFINHVWTHIKVNYPKLLQKRELYQHSWGDCHAALSVFCTMFIFYTETLIDKENSNTTDTFNKSDLCYMGRLLKTVSKDIIEVAFPMSRSSAMPPSAAFQYLFQLVLYALKTLHMLDLREQFCPPGFWTAEKIFIPNDLGKNSYLTQTPVVPLRLYNTQRDGDEAMPPLSTIEQRCLAILEELPFLIPFNARVVLLRQLFRNSVSDVDYQRLHNELVNGRPTVIRRTHLYEDAFEKISSKSDADLKYKIRIQFINSIGLEEVGVDGGGIFKEFITEFLKTAFDPNRGFFLLTADNTLYPNPNVHLIVEKYTEHYYFIGRMLGKAIFENILVDLPLAEFFLAKLLIERVSAHYLKSLDPLLHKNLLFLRDFAGDISELGLDFTIVNHDLGETRVVELKQNGRHIPVTNENRLEYIQRLADFKLNVQLRKQCASFREGLCSVIPLRWLYFFDHKEVQILVGGNNQEIDVDDLIAHTIYGGEFAEDHPTILLFWRVFRSFTDPQRKQLLKFVTSCSRPPLFGFKELHPKFCIQSSGSENRMPTASTCLNLLKLPIIREEDLLRNKLLEAIEQQAGFELS